MVADTFFKLERELEKIMCSNIEDIELIGPIFPGVQKRQNQFHGYVLLKAIKRSDLANACRYMANRNYRVDVVDQNTNCLISDTISIPGYDNVFASFFSSNDEITI